MTFHTILKFLNGNVTSLLKYVNVNNVIYDPTNHKCVNVINFILYSDFTPIIYNKCRLFDIIFIHIIIRWLQCPIGSLIEY